MEENKKAKTFKEWWDFAYAGRTIPIPNEPIIKIWSERAFNSARIGFIPEDRAIEIPDVEEWPEWSVGLVMGYTDKKKLLSPIDDSIIAYIPRHSPKFNLKSGDTVFVKEDFFVAIGKYLQWNNETYRHDVHVSGKLLSLSNDFVKPFSADKAGLKWEDI